MSAHAKLGASNAHRWLMCPGSVAAEDGLPDTTSPAAAEGTVAHELAELALRTGATALNSFADHEMAEYVREYFEYVMLHQGDNTLMIEERVDYSDWVPGGFGTADAIIIGDDKLHIVDLKYGMGVRVDAENNPQGMLYALGVWAQYGWMTDAKEITISIVQPRLYSVSEWSIGVDDLLRWAEWAKQRAEATADPDAPRVPGESQCKFCKAKASCAALRDYTEAALMVSFSNLDDIPPANTLTDDQMSAALEARPLIEAWLSAIADHAKTRLADGETFDGWKLVEGRSVRRWIDEGVATEALVNMLGLDAYAPKKLLSPAQAEKALGKGRKAEIGKLITKPMGAPTLAPASDNRPAINVSDADFDDCAD